MPETALVTRYLLAWQQDPDDAQVAEQLSRLTYEYLRQMASSRLRGEAEQHFTPTELVHEAWMNLKPTGTAMTSRNQFFRLASTVMRNLLVDHARERLAAKRGGYWLRLTLSAADREETVGNETLLDLDRALDRLAREHPRPGDVVVLRCFGGLKLSEIANTLEISLATVKRDWSFACAWLGDALSTERTGP
ncbi:MAG: ECF-type sigma factor [Wenzhouxiangella sp.]